LDFKEDKMAKLKKLDEYGAHKLKQFKGKAKLVGDWAERKEEKLEEKTSELPEKVVKRILGK
jgi:hypothetical protein